MSLNQTSSQKQPQDAEQLRLLRAENTNLRHELKQATNELKQATQIQQLAVYLGTAIHRIHDLDSTHKLLYTATDGVWICDDDWQTTRISQQSSRYSAQTFEIAARLFDTYGMLFLREDGCTKLKVGDVTILSSYKDPLQLLNMTSKYLYIGELEDLDVDIYDLHVVDLAEKRVIQHFDDCWMSFITPGLIAESLDNKANTCRLYVYDQDAGALEKAQLPELSNDICDVSSIDTNNKLLSHAEQTVLSYLQLDRKLCEISVKFATSAAVRARATVQLLQSGLSADVLLKIPAEKLGMLIEPKPVFHASRGKL